MSNMQMMPQNGQMMPQNGQMMPQNGQMMPQSGQMMPQSGQMMPQNGQMMPQNGKMMPQIGQMGSYNMVVKKKKTSEIVGIILLILWIVYLFLFGIILLICGIQGSTPIKPDPEPSLSRHARGLRDVVGGITSKGIDSLKAAMGSDDPSPSAIAGVNHNLGIEPDDPSALAGVNHNLGMALISLSILHLVGGFYLGFQAISKHCVSVVTLPGAGSSYQQLYPYYQEGHDKQYAPSTTQNGSYVDLQQSPPSTTHVALQPIPPSNTQDGLHVALQPIPPSTT